MSIPPALARAIDDAQAAMRQDHMRELHPLHRARIYEAIGPYQSVRADQIRGRLALSTVQRVLRLRPPEATYAELADHLVTTGQAVLWGQVQRAAARAEANNGWEFLDNVGSNPRLTSTQASFFATQAAVQCLLELAGDEPFAGMELANETDGTLDPWSSDTAKWAAFAIAGRPWDTDSDAAARQEFWEWWLGEAIPTAWR
jgi:hypothetical protein